LPSNRHTDQTEGLKKYAVEMGSGTIIYTPGFMKIGFGIHKITGGIYRHTDSMEIA
jgi:hypothetical protein